MFLTYHFFWVLIGSLNAEGEDTISTWDEVHETFDVMGLHENLLRGIYAYGTDFYAGLVEFLIVL
jgi:hypothetical protein